MINAVVLTAVTVVAKTVSGMATADTRTPQTYNVGRFIQVRGSANYVFKVHADPASFAMATCE